MVRVILTASRPLPAGQLEGAARLGYEALKVLRNEPQIYFNLANVFGKNGRHEESEAMFLTAIKLDESNARFHLNLGKRGQAWSTW